MAWETEAVGLAGVKQRTKNPCHRAEPPGQRHEDQVPEETCLFSLPIKEFEITVFLLGASFKDEVLKIMPV